VLIDQVAESAVAVQADATLCIGVVKIGEDPGEEVLIAVIEYLIGHEAPQVRIVAVKRFGDDGHLLEDGATFFRGHLAQFGRRTVERTSIRSR
jgi:hypothetical protein